MKNPGFVLLYLAAGYALPLLPRSAALMGHYKILLLMAACVVMLAWANPPIRFTEGRQKKDSDRGTMPLIFLLGYLALVAPVVEWAYCRTDRGWTLWTNVGLAVMVAGLWFRIWSLRVLGRYFTGSVQRVEGHRLVTEGPYRVLRHPSYLGSLATFLGCAVLLEAWVGLAVALACMSVAYFFRIRAEEKLLLAVFGDDYRAYQQKTWRLAPGLW